MIIRIFQNYIERLKSDVVTLGKSHLELEHQTIHQQQELIKEKIFQTIRLITDSELAMKRIATLTRTSKQTTRLRSRSGCTK